MVSRQYTRRWLLIPLVTALSKLNLNFFTKFKILILYFRWYLFGCVSVTSDGDYTFIPAPEGTWYNGNDVSEWVGMMAAYCS